MKLFLWFVAGEESGDARAFEVMRAIRELNPSVRFGGAGGERMESLCEGSFDNWIQRAAVVGLWDVLKNYGYFRGKFEENLRAILTEKPDAVVLVDYPGFNLRLAKALRARGYRGKILYYISPQVWAWNRARIPRMARWLDRMFCIFPFEKDLYEKSGLHTDFVGHPMTAQSEIIGDEPRNPNLLALLPGSREREVRKIFPALLAAAKIVLARRPQTVLASAASSEKLQHLMREMAAHAGVGCDIGLRNARDLMQTAAAGLIASGTATLEATLCGLPYALVYKVAPLTYLAGRAVIKVPHLGMANILAGKEIVKEFIQQGATPTNLAAEALRLLDDAAYRDRMREDFSKVRTKLIAPAAVSPARAVLEVLS